MTSVKPRDFRTDELLSTENSAIVIIDVQPVRVASLASMEKRALVQNVGALAQMAKKYRMPVVLSTVNAETGRNKPMIHQVTDALADVRVYDRTTRNAWEDTELFAAIEATGRKDLIVSALWTEVCLTFPTLSALRDGYEVDPVVEACGSTSLAAHEASRPSPTSRASSSRSKGADAQL